ncbi:4Fe-4S dicluster domain-containing protein [Yersinia canariae]|uniref:4Fe-4S dicluster domain-containing protein n=1 Tax=Yersinia canariae TaxID=2607663 RepID=A0A857EXA0_9GAMM|nr:4Fe-4S dicluster domain-containing protein [Yersinia canariae]QHB31129.1 4Fe-4S dicluster domain-containing protein [Yersinia canariae]
MNRFVIADMTQCIGCRTCEIACVVAHSAENKASAITPDQFHPRLSVMKSFAVSTPILCHQCEDAPCENSCPNGAIVTGDHGVQVLASRCIGCKTCMLVCPFGAMNMIEQINQNATVSAQAHKCDLCHSRETGPACIEVCPTKALKLVTPRALENLQRDRQLRAARGAASGIAR